jgi:hypothetical protein
MPSAALPQPPDRRLDRILSPNHPLCKEDVVWVLEYVKKKVAEPDPRLLDLAPPRLLKNFQHFAEAATMLIQRRPGCESEADRLRALLAEATYGLWTAPPERQAR